LFFNRFLIVLPFFRKLRKISFQKINWLIDFLWIFHRFSYFLPGKVGNPNLKVQFFYCSILIVQTMFCENLKLEISVDQPQLIPKVELCRIFHTVGRSDFHFSRNSYTLGSEKLRMIMTTKLLLHNFLKFWDLPLANGSWRLKILKKKIHGRVKI
jgi:hypothetical protein